MPESSHRSSGVPAFNRPDNASASWLDTDVASPATGLMRKLLLRFVLPIAFVSAINSLDRVNISYAGFGMMRDLRISPTEFGVSVSAFFLAYLLFQYPHAALLRRLGLRVWLCASVLLWAVAGLWMSRVQSIHEIYAARFLLGIAEAGFAPSMTYSINRWIPREYRASAMAMALASVPVSLVIGGPFCGWLLSLHNPLGMTPWRWLFLVQAILTLAVAVAVGLSLIEEPGRASWLNEHEKQQLGAQLAREEKGPRPAVSFAAIVADPRVWRCCIFNLLMMTGSYALVFWLPQLVRRLGQGQSELLIGTLSALPQAGLLVGLFANGRHSDRSGERRRHAGLPLALTGVALMIAALLVNGWWVLALLVVAGAGLGAAQGVFWTIPAAIGIGGGRVPVAAIAIISMFGTSGGIVGPALVGFMRQQTGGFGPAIMVLAAMTLLASLLMLSWRAGPSSTA